MSDHIPITSQLAMALVEFVCPKMACGLSLPKTLHLEEYIDRELIFERGEAKDGIILVKANGQDAFELKEEGAIANLEYKTEFNFCPNTKLTTCSSLIAPDGKVVQSSCYETPRPPCENPVKLMIAALFGEEELKNAVLSEAEKARVLQLRAALGLRAAGDQESPSLKIEAPAATPQGSFFSDRWKGWRAGGGSFFNFYGGPGGGVKLWVGARQDRWEFRASAQGDAVLLRKDDAYDFRLGASFEPLFHLLERPLLFDPYLHLPEIGFYRLFNVGGNPLHPEAWGLSFSPLGAGVQIHLNDTLSIYGGVKLMGAFTFEEKPKVGIDAPFGFSARL
ncbi:MAG: hypothetical protein U1F57_08740 [bacterium]